MEPRFMGRPESLRCETEDEVSHGDAEHRARMGSPSVRLGSADRRRPSVSDRSAGLARNFYVLTQRSKDVSWFEPATRRPDEPRDRSAPAISPRSQGAL